MKKVIFDVDGVLLSEKRYFDVSALTVWEWYNSPLYLNLGGEQIKAELDDTAIASLRARYWQDDAILNWMKLHGINSNWDMVHAHVVVTLWLMLERQGWGPDQAGQFPLAAVDDVRALGRSLAGCTLPDAAAVLDRLVQTVPPEAGKDDVFTCLGQAMRPVLGDVAASWANLGSPLWQLLFECFQEWYFGDDLYETTYGKKPYNPGKPGFLQREQPLGAVSAIKGLFQELKRRGYAIAIATGRSWPEVRIPFTTFDWLSEFDQHYICTDTDVVAAEDLLHQSLDKPNPFVYYVAAFGKAVDRYGAYAADPDQFKQGQYFVVGDSLADVWCAKAMGAVMIGTLTGLDGANARTMFEQAGADYIVDSVLDIAGILK